MLTLHQFQQPDIIGSYSAGLRDRATSQTMKSQQEKEQKRNYLQSLLKDPSRSKKSIMQEALATDPEVAVNLAKSFKYIEGLDAEGASAMREALPHLYGFLQMSDTPEKWEENKPYLKQLGLDDKTAEYIGEFDQRKRAMMLENIAITKGALDKKIETFGDMQEIPGMPGYVGQKSKITGKLANITNTKDKEKTDSGYKPSTANSIRDGVALVFSGRYDPTTNTFLGLSKDVGQKAAAIASEAEKIYRKSKGAIEINEAVTLSAKRFGIELPSPIDENASKPPINDPANIRNFLNGLQR